ncbi:MAG: hypothetical protein HC866_11015 [Leptolyngbyaceae cyanobacterium RU_5_1]|nr:hypothetical protein [Leptolyngbyaceae cyanobacterium RU_5_1]
MFIANLDHLEVLDEMSNLSGGQLLISPIFLTISNGNLILKSGENELLNTLLPGFPSGITVSLNNVPSYTISGTTQSPNGALQTFFTSSGVGSQNNSTVSFSFSQSTVTYPNPSR